MKKSMYYFIAISILSLFISCGPSAAEVAAIQQRRDDSIKNAVERKFALEAEITKTENALQNYQDNLKNEKAAYEVEKDNMNRVKEFHFLRTESEREEQIRNQSLRIQTFEENIASLEKNISQIQERIASLKTEVQQYH